MPAIGLLLLLSTLVSFFNSSLPDSKEDAPPNILIILCDDLGYGDLGVYGSTINRTPAIDQMASEGMQFTQFYASASVCTPSRASLMTGCYPQRIDMAEMREEGFRSVLLPGFRKGLNPQEITLAEMLKPKGYRTALIGKWHLGEPAQFLPTRQGFDYYFGTTGSNNFEGDFGLYFMENERVVEQPVNQSSITRRYTDKTLEFIQKDSDRPFFVLLSHNMPHFPVHASDAYRGRSPHGIYSDAVEELDGSVKKILDYIKDSELAGQTLVFFTSDNGGSLRHGGINTPLKGEKGTTWEGGFRVPMIAWGPGSIAQGKVNHALATMMDFMPTLHEIVYQTPYHQAVIDGYSLWPALQGQTEQSQYQAFFYYDRDQLQAVRSGPWKLHLPLPHRFKAHHTDKGEPFAGALYHLDNDPGEEHNLFETHPKEVKRLAALAKKARYVLGSETQKGAYIRPAGFALEKKVWKLED